MTTREEHLAFCKRRALEYLPNDVSGALASMISDLGKHEDTARHAGIRLTLMLMIGGHLETAEQVKRHIEGFN
jgi:hypothetical protein